MALILSGCAAEPEVARPPDGTPLIEASGFSGLFGGAFVRVWQGDVVELDVRNFETRENSLDRAVIPGAFAAATDAVTRLGSAAQASPSTFDGECMDYGSDRITSTPPIGGFAEVRRDCPMDAVGALTQAIFAIAEPLGD